MQHVLDRATDRHFPGVRLVQAAYHARSLSLYTKLGYNTRETLSTMQGDPLNLQIPGYTVRAATTAMPRFVIGYVSVCMATTATANWLMRSDRATLW